MDYRKLETIVPLGKDSQLKRDLNKGIASLFSAPESWHQPHVCLNEEEGLEVIKKVAENPNPANTQFFFTNRLILDGDMWLNIAFGMYLNECSRPRNFVQLTPRQTSYIIRHLPEDSQATVLAKAKAWYLEALRKDMLEAIDTITAQFETGYPLLANDYDNRIFDIHGGRHEVPYVEWGIVGENLFSAHFFGTCLNYGTDGYARMDRLITGQHAAIKEAAGFLR